jgi:prepilin signal peptidase PulO-like enzyme (type II secretory pathway)
MALTGPPPAVPAAAGPPGQAAEPRPTGDPGASGSPPRFGAAAVVAVLTIGPVLRLAALRHAVPSGTATGCVGCGAPVGLTRPWPALGPAARCGRCRARVGPPPATVELAALAALVVLALVGPPLGPLAALAWWLGWTVPAVFADLAVHRLPDRLTLPAAAGTWLLLGLAALGGAGGTPLLRALAAGTGLALFFAASTLLLGQRGFGLGDAKLALGVGALLGWHSWPYVVSGLLLALGLSALVSLGLLAARRARWSTHLPFGPFLLLGTIGALLLAT